MSYRFETASGLRFYACDKRLRMGQTSSIQFLDPFESVDFERVELLFESKSTAKHCRLNNRFFHTCLKQFGITPKSLFLYEVDTENIATPGIYTLRLNNTYEILSSPWMVIQ